MKYATLFSVLKGRLFSMFFRQCGKNTRISSNVSFNNMKNIIAGNNVSFQKYVQIIVGPKQKIIIGNNSKIGSFSIIKCDFQGANTSFSCGENFGCGDFCFFGCAGGIKIGNNVIMGQNVRFHAQNHIFSSTEIPIREQGTVENGIIVGDDCWIGAGTTVLDGVKIGDGCVIGANSLINKDIPSFSIVVGNPMRIIGSR